MHIMTSGEIIPTHFTKNELGADGVGGFIPYGLRLDGEFFVDAQTGARSDPGLMHCPDHAADVSAYELSERNPQVF